MPFFVERKPAPGPSIQLRRGAASPPAPIPNGKIVAPGAAALGVRLLQRCLRLNVGAERRNVVVGLAGESGFQQRVERGGTVFAVARETMIFALRHFHHAKSATFGL